MSDQCKGCKYEGDACSTVVFGECQSRESSPHVPSKPRTQAGAG